MNWINVKEYNEGEPQFHDTNKRFSTNFITGSKDTSVTEKGNIVLGRDEDPTFFSKDPDPGQLRNPLLQVGSGSDEKNTESGSGGPKINGSDRILILIPDFCVNNST